MNDKLKEEIRKTLGILKNGGVILYPTDTIWGLGCDATNPEAVKRIYDIKKRADNRKNSEKNSLQNAQRLHLRNHLPALFASEMKFSKQFFFIFSPTISA